MGSAAAADHRPGELLRRRHGPAGGAQRRHRCREAEVRRAMTAKDTPFDLAVARAAVRLDTEGVLGAFLEGRFDVDESIGDSTWLGESSEFFAVRWRFEGRHVGPIPGFGHTEIRAT